MYKSGAIDSRVLHATVLSRFFSSAGDGALSLWVFGGQGKGATTNTDFSRIHQGVNIRTLAKRTCLNDLHEFDAITRRAMSF